MKCRIDFFATFWLWLELTRPFNRFKKKEGTDLTFGKAGVWKHTLIHIYRFIIIRIQWHISVFHIEFSYLKFASLLLFLPTSFFLLSLLSIFFSFIIRFILSFFTSEKDMLNTFEICSNILAVIKSEWVTKNEKKNLLFFVQVATSNPVRNNNSEYLFNKDFSFVYNMP